MIEHDGLPDTGQSQHDGQGHWKQEQPKAEGLHECCERAMANCQPHCPRCGNETWLLRQVRAGEKQGPELIGDILRRVEDLEQLLLAGIQPGAEHSLTGRVRAIVEGLRKAHSR